MTRKRVMGIWALGACMALGAVAHAESWRKISLRSAEGLDIHVDTVINKSGSASYKPSYSHTASPLFVSVRGPQLKPSSKVRIVLNNYNYGMRNAVPQAYVLDLKASHSAQYGFHFSGELGDAKVDQSYLDLGTGKQTPLLAGISGYGGNHAYPQAVAVVADKTWQTDPVNGSHNFQFELGLGNP